MVYVHHAFMDKDPASSIASMSEYQPNLYIEIVAFLMVNKYFADQHVVFDESEPGYIFTHFI